MTTGRAITDEQNEYVEQVFDRLDLKDGRLESKTLDLCVFKNCDLTGAGLRFCKFRECRFESCNLSLVKISASSFQGTVFKNSKLTGVNWCGAEWPRLNLAGPLQFHDCVLADSSFFGVKAPEIVIKNCLAKGADFREADLGGADLSGTDLSEALFGSTNLAKADLTGAKNYVIDPRTNIIKNAKFSLPEAMTLLTSLDIEIV